MGVFEGRDSWVSVVDDMQLDEDVLIIANGREFSSCHFNVFSANSFDGLADICVNYLPGRCDRLLSIPR